MSTVRADWNSTLMEENLSRHCWRWSLDETCEDFFLKRNIQDNLSYSFSFFFLSLSFSCVLDILHHWKYRRVAVFACCLLIDLSNSAHAGVIERRNQSSASYNSKGHRYGQINAEKSHLRVCRNTNDNPNLWLNANDHCWAVLYSIIRLSADNRRSKRDECRRDTPSLVDHLHSHNPIGSCSCRWQTKRTRTDVRTRRDESIQALVPLSSYRSLSQPPISPHHLLVHLWSNTLFISRLGYH